MKIRDLLAHTPFSLSFEVFPPQREGSIESLYRTVEALRELQPQFFSVTYGAGGGTRDMTVEIASKIKNDHDSEVLAHLTCVQATRRDIADILKELQENNIANILALRGDPPAGEENFATPKGGFGNAGELVKFIASEGDFSIGVAGYPEVHIEALTLEADVAYLKKKVDAGADFVITQLFFDNDCFYRFRDRALKTGINVPIIAGIFPLFNFKQIEKVTSLSNTKIPPALHDKLFKVREKPEEVEKYGIEYAIAQAGDLIAHEVAGIHFYSMNRSRHVIRIVKELDLPH